MAEFCWGLIENVFKPLKTSLDVKGKGSRFVVNGRKRDGDRNQSRWLARKPTCGL